MTNCESNEMGDHGREMLEMVVEHLEQRGFTRRGRMGKPGFDLLGPDGRVVVYGFDPAVGGAPKEVAVHLWQAAQRFLK